jgi:DNA-binding response OmpR family regulator
VLIVDDAEQVRDLLARALERDGFAVEQAADGEEALSAVASRPPALVILDVNLPKLDGLQVLGRLKRAGDVPVILLTGRGEEPDRIAGLDLGADDYVVKPFSPGEVVARVRAVLRRNPRPAPGSRLEFPDLVIDLEQREVLVDGDVVDLTRREFDLLAYLASSPGQVFSREQLLQQVWGSSSSWQSDATVTEHVRRLRRKIEDDPDNPRWIATVRGVGYRFEP